MAKMVPKIVKCAGTLNRHLRVLHCGTSSHFLALAHYFQCNLVNKKPKNILFSRIYSMLNNSEAPGTLRSLLFPFNLLLVFVDESDWFSDPPSEGSC